ncbi:pyridoxal phosphate-dependent transferase [Staphylotrichum tortipilum]|uniref:Pyridoxal phosphate-dependent transferase n=1 Tax=Staphylotrichum tortipilum TaxID=2831512 RepID=A0AAN6RWH0_9PEZI|nr:pyridoxal phosphate-dependent transferase [Staphylotrichum longicolle]
MADTTNDHGDTPPPPKPLINLLRGWPSPHLLPASLLRTAADYVLADPSISVPVLQYGIDPGYQPLREELARWLTAQYASPAAISPDEIAITGGASQSLACILQSFTDPGYTRAVWAVAPCYFMACPIFDDAGFYGRLRAVPEDDEGVDVEALARGLREADDAAGADPSPTRRFKSATPHLRKLYRHVIYLVATCSNPSGKTLSLARREKLIHLARKHDALIISDDVYDLLQWPVTPPPEGDESSPLPPLLPLLSQIDLALGPSPHNPSQDSSFFSHAISNASFSKLVGPGVRTGWIHASPAFAAGFAHTGTNRSGGAASQFAAAVVWRVLSTGALQGYLDGTVRPALARRWRLMVGVLEQEVGGLGVRVWRGNGVGGAGTMDERGEMFGGYFVWLTLPGGLDAEEVAERARVEEELVIAPGRLFEVSGDEGAARFPGNVRLCFSWEEEENIVEGVVRFGRVLRRMLAGEAGGKGKGEAGEVEADKFK